MRPARATTSSTTAVQPGSNFGKAVASPLLGCLRSRCMVHPEAALVPSRYLQVTFRCPSGKVSIAASGKLGPRYSPSEVSTMNSERMCLLCNQPADISPVSGVEGHRELVECQGECPPYVITRRAKGELTRKPNLRAVIAAEVKLLYTQDPEDMPVVRMTKGSQGLVVMAHSHETGHKA